MKIVAARNLLKANDQLAAEIRRRLTARGVLGVNLVGSPGCGKTTLLEALLRHWSGRLRTGVVEGDIAGQVDAERVAAEAAAVVQINTDGMCHLEAALLGQALDGLDLDALDVVVIENVGNLVCTAGFDLGEHVRLAALSVPEGDDKLIKYPALFRSSHALAVTKTDLLGPCPFDVDRVRRELARLAPEAPVFLVSAVRGEGVAELAQWLEQQRRAAARLE